MKDYEKMYKRLIKEIKGLLKNESYFKAKDTALSSRDIDIAIKQVEKDYAISLLNVILEMEEEISGKQCNMCIMNQEDFKNWKEKIKGKK